MSLDDFEKQYLKAEHLLRDVLFGDGVFTPGLVKGDERRLEVTRVLRRMRKAFDAAAQAEAARAETAEARVTDLEEELVRLTRKKKPATRRPRKTTGTTTRKTRGKTT